MQCKDIPDATVLRYLLLRKGQWSFLGGPRNPGIELAMPECTPRKLVLAKMRSLVKRKLVTGCACGCRGDFEITPLGEALLG